MRLLIVSNKQRLSNYIEFVEALDSFGVEAICVHNLKYCSLSEFRPLNIVPFPKLLSLVKRFNPDFILTDSPYYIPHMAKLVDHRVLFHMRGVWDEFYWQKVTHPSLFVRIYNNYLDKIIIPSVKQFDLFLPNSKWLQKMVKKRMPNVPTQVLYVGIDSEKWVPIHNTTSNLKHPAVVSAFSFGVYAKLSGLLKFIRVIKKMPDVNFYFAGRGDYSNLIEQNYPSNIHFIGRISRSEIKKLLGGADILVHPSGADSSPRIIKEASLMEKPTIASNVGGIPEIVKNNETGYLCNIDNVDQWIRKIRFLLDNPDVAGRFGKNAREFVKENFDWRKIAESFLKNLRSFATKKFES